MPPTSIEPQPFLRWAGGKQRQATALARYLPPNLHNLRYVEPFAGAGSLFFRANPRVALLADLNPHLMQAYSQVRDNPRLVARMLKAYRRADSEDYYYQVRSEYNSSLRRASATQAARFIYLNRTCFNGIFRVNRAGYFNVPYGKKHKPVFPSEEHLIAASRRLRRTQLRCQCFRDTLRQLKGNSFFVYLDPPYPALNGTSYFSHYTKDRFNEQDQKDLAALTTKLASAGVQLMLSNADTDLIRHLYADFNITTLSVTRSITCKSSKVQVRDLVVTNY